MDLVKKQFRLSLLASSTAAIAAGAVSVIVSAQEENTVENTVENAVEEVVVTGIRQSLEQAMDIKRDAQGVVDAISAEDIGKFPDSNLAEAMQRITGVSIDRQNGEGSRVTVRGFGPDYNIVTLNGRQMPSANINETSSSSSRSFDFQNLAAESVSGVEIYKTGKASLLTGGIGSSINIKTARPLENPGMTASFGVKAVTDTTNRRGDDTTPEISGIFSDTFLDDTIGVALSGSYQERNSTQRIGRTESWYSAIISDENRSLFTPTGSTAGFVDNEADVPPNGSIFSRPQNAMYRIDDFQRKRTNAQLTLQWQPIEQLKTTLDYTYSELDFEQQRQEFAAWFGTGIDQGNQLQSGLLSSVDASGNTAPLVLVDTNGADINFGSGAWGTKNEINSVGLNLEWAPTDNLTFSLDYHDSDAELGAKDDLGTNNLIATAAFVRSSTVVDYRGDLPTIFIRDEEEQPSPVDQIVGSGIQYRNGFMKTEIEQLQFNGEFTFDEGPVKSIDFGLARSTMENQTAFQLTEQGNWGGVGDPEVFADTFEARSLVDEYEGLSSGDVVSPVYNQVNYDDLSAAYAGFIAENDSNLAPGWAHCPGFGDNPGTPVFCSRPGFDNDGRLEEEQTAAYIQGNFEFDVADMPMSVALGLRYEDTDVTSQSNITNYTGQLWNADNQFNIFADENTPIIPSSGSASYDNVLPNLDIALNVTEDLVTRASYSKTITRQLYTSLHAGTSPNNAQARADGFTPARSGNPGLLPYESTNFDLSVEFYYGEGSYVSLGYYQKDVENFTGTGVVNEQSTTLVQPASGSRFAEAVAEAENQGIPANDHLRFAREEYFVEQGWIDPDTGELLEGTDSFDPLTFAVSIPIAGREASIDGFEFAFQHLFADTGIGTIFNLTTVNGDVEFDRTSLDQQFVLQGLSDSANLVLFYDKNGLQARLAYNWRDDFLAGTGANNSGQQQPFFTEAYGQLDANLSYDINDNFTVFAEAINLNEADVRVHARTRDQLTFFAEQKARYNVGMRYGF